MPRDDREILTTADVARALCIRERTVNRLAHHLKPSLSSTGQRLYRRDVVEAFAGAYDIKHELKTIRRKARKALRADTARQRDEQIAERFEAITRGDE